MWCSLMELMGTFGPSSLSLLSANLFVCIYYAVNLFGCGPTAPLVCSSCLGEGELRRTGQSVGSV